MAICNVKAASTVYRWYTAGLPPRFRELLERAAALKATAPRLTVRESSDGKIELARDPSGRGFWVDRLAPLDAIRVGSALVQAGARELGRDEPAEPPAAAGGQ